MLLILICSRVFYANNSVDSVFSVPFLQEGIYGLALGYALLRPLLIRQHVDVLFSLLVPLFVLLAMLLSALFAYLTFGQPLQYGLLEERRMLALLIGLMIYDLLAHARLREPHIYGLISCATIVVFVISIIAQSQLTEVVGEREGRFRTVGYFFAIMALFLLHRRLTRGGLLALPLLACCIYAVISISQTRIITLGLSVAAMLLILSRRPLVSLLVATIVPATLFIGALVEPNLFAFLDSSDVVNDSSAQVRQYSLDLFLNYLARNGYIAGFGALSLQWNEGFFRLASGRFREHVFLSDLGIFGELFRYGLVFIPIMSLLIWIFNRARPRRGEYGSRFYMAALIFVLVCSVTLGTFSNQGESLGIVLAFGLWFRQQAALERNDAYVMRS